MTNRNNMNWNDIISFDRVQARISTEDSAHVGRWSTLEGRNAYLDMAVEEQMVGEVGSAKRAVRSELQKVAHEVMAARA